MSSRLGSRLSHRPRPRSRFHYRCCPAAAVVVVVVVDGGLEQVMVESVDRAGIPCMMVTAIWPWQGDAGFDG